MRSSSYIETTRRVVKCPYCDSEKLAKWGTTSEGNQRYRCGSDSCKRTFLDTGTLNGRRMDPDMVGSAIRDYFTGKSYKQIAEGLQEEYDLKKEPSKATVFEWVRDYTDEALKQMEGHKAKTSGHWVADELELKVNKTGKAKAYIWNVMDSKTRYLLASYLTPRRDAAAARVVLRKAALAADKPPKTIKTDRLRSYIKPIKDVFPEAKHIQSQGVHAEINNNLSERVQGTFRDRLKTLRQLDGIETGNHYLDGWMLNYNMFRKHEALDNRTPGEAAKVNPPFKEWADVVKAEAAPRPKTARARPASQSIPKPRSPQPKIAPPKAKAQAKVEPPKAKRRRGFKTPKPRYPKVGNGKPKRRTPPPWSRLRPRLPSRN